MSAKVGPKELQVRALRLARASGVRPRIPQHKLREVTVVGPAKRNSVKAAKKKAPKV